jgi:hypothetical protein
MRLCIICGARVRNQNPKSDTCDPVCTRAKHAGRSSRAEQLRFELTNPGVESPLECPDCGHFLHDCQCWNNEP